MPLVTGGTARYVNLDNAASTPALGRVRDRVVDFLGWYSSVHRGAGFKSRASTAAYEGARESIRRFVNARDEHVVIFTRNTTDSINMLAGTLTTGSHVVTFASEHHANLLPWKRFGVQILPAPDGPEEMLQQLATALARMPRCDDPHLVAVTGASNVTGEVWPLADIAEVAHQFGARLFVDAAQLAPHLPIDMTRDGIDYLALSGHKLYAPFGAGALIGPRDWLGTGDPFLRGGGAVRLVTVDDTVWADLPDRQEAGTPNVVGAVALGVACDALMEVGMPTIATEEAELLTRVLTRLSSVNGFRHHHLWSLDHPRVGLVTFSLGGMPHDLLAAVLSAEYGIGVRHGCFCAHPLMMRLLGVGDEEGRRLIDLTRAGQRPRLPGATRMSLGLATTVEDIDDFADAIESIASGGPRWTYVENRDTGEFEPVPDPRRLPGLSIRMVEHPGARAVPGIPVE